MDLKSIVAANVKRHRIHLGFSQEQLSHLTGLHRTYIGSVERAERNITLSTLETLSAALGVCPPQLLKAAKDGRS